MIAIIQKDTQEPALRQLAVRLMNQGVRIGRTPGRDSDVLTLVGDTWRLDPEGLAALPYVLDVRRITPPYRLAGRAAHPDNTVVEVGDARIGAEFCLIAGPCAVESQVQMAGVARRVKAAGAQLLQAAEYILAGGNERVILCERGIRTFETDSRATLDIAAIPVLKKMTHLPVIVDPSHAAGRAELVAPLALAAVAAGADGLMVEVHDRPACALSDGAQALSCDQFDRLAGQVRELLPHACRWWRAIITASWTGKSAGYTTPCWRVWRPWPRGSGCPGWTARSCRTSICG